MPQIGPGRPEGTTGERPEKVAVITWKPRHDRIVMLHLAGYKNFEIARLMRCTKQRVGEILLDPRARVLIQKGRNQLINGLMSDIDGRLVQLAHKSIVNLARTVDCVISPKHPAKRHQDKVGLDLLKMIGYGDDGGKGSADDTKQLSNETMERLTKALEVSERVRSNGVELAVIQDAEIIEEDETEEESVQENISTPAPVQRVVNG